MEGVLFIILYVILTILYSIPPPRVLPLLHHESRATRQHAILSLHTNTSEIFSDVSSEVDTCSPCLSAVETEADTGLVLTTQTSRLTSLIHKHCYIATKEEKDCTKKIY